LLTSLQKSDFLFYERQEKSESRALADSTLNVNFTAMFANDTPNDHQAQTCSAATRGEERLEKMI
jgi:hypothetical protein